MNKKSYITPDVKEIKMTNMSCLLSGSVKGGGDAGDIGWGGAGGKSTSADANSFFDNGGDESW